MRTTSVTIITLSVVDNFDVLVFVDCCCQYQEICLSFGQYMHLLKMLAAKTRRNG